MVIPFSPPYIDDEVISEVVSTLKSGWITTGSKVKNLEIFLCNYTKTKSVICVNSWTSGAILALKWFGIKEGDEVIIPAYTYCATALAVLHCGAIPVMVDINKDFTIDPEKIEKAITGKTKVIIPVDFGGFCCNYDKINDIVAKSNIKNKFKPNGIKQTKLGRILILADAAHSLGARYNNMESGSLTDITIFSFHAVKNITTGEGGAICLNLPENFDNEEEYNLMKLYTLNGQNKDAFTKSQTGAWKYDILFAGLKVNMPDICAAIGLAQIRKYKTVLIKERERVAQLYNHYFSKYDFF